MRTYGWKVVGDDYEYNVDDKAGKTRQSPRGSSELKDDGEDDGGYDGADDGDKDGNHRELKDDGEGAEAKEAKHGEAEQDRPVDVLNVLYDKSFFVQ